MFNFTSEDFFLVS